MTRTSLIASSLAVALALAGCGGADQPSRRQAALEEAVSLGNMVLADESGELCENLTDSARWKMTLLFAGSRSEDDCPEAMHRFATLVSKSKPEFRQEVEGLGPEVITFEGDIATVDFSDTTKTMLEEVDGRWYLSLPPEPESIITPIR